MDSSQLHEKMNNLNGLEDISHHIICFKNKSKFKISWGILYNLKTKIQNKTKQNKTI